MIRLALLGKGISHSLSPSLYRQIYGEENVHYELFDYNSEEEIPSLKDLFNNLDGLSITSPYKKHFVKSVEIDDPIVKNFGAINCIGKRGGVYFATNTDLTALRRLTPSLVKNKRILVLGDGVMASLFKLVCNELKLDYVQWSRKLTPEKFSKMNLSDFKAEELIIVNCCAREFVFEGELIRNSIFWDLNYSHKEHLERFAKVSNYIDGYNLLEAQAQDAAAFWSSLKN